MCLIAYHDDGIAVVLAARIRTARKQHSCHECYRKIMPGEKYHDERHLWDGELQNYKICPHCDVARDWLTEECGGFLYTAIQEDILEHANEQHYGVGVAKLAAGMRVKWRRKNGQLFSIPKRPPLTRNQ